MRAQVDYDKVDRIAKRQTRMQSELEIAMRLIKCRATFPMLQNFTGMNTHEFAPIKADGAAMKVDLAAIKADIASLKSETKTDSEELKTEMVRWEIGIKLATVVLLVSIFKYL